MPKDAAPTRSAILASALQTLKRDGLQGFSLRTVARRAGVAKGLIAYHFGSSRQLLALCGRELAAERDGRLARALEQGSGAAPLDACWEELVRQQADGTAGAWLALCGAGFIDRSDKQGGFEGTARRALLDGCTAVLAATTAAGDLKDAYHALWLALLDVTEPS